ncbi:MAG: hypothetical protein Q8K59_13185, partial [Nitrosomonas sp.]|nr:hypothetical protein [Nitrosomonas sp.]MDP1952012.1 hypothetical protein [Nitrosomonas sp.]
YADFFLSDSYFMLTIWVNDSRRKFHALTHLIQLLLIIASCLTDFFRLMVQRVLSASEKYWLVALIIVIVSRYV